MSFIFSSLVRKAGEDQDQFDCRISSMIPFLAGRVYFDIRNYDEYSGEFSVYIEWDEELMTKLHHKLSSGGFFVRATNAQAEAFHELATGLPVYMKLISRQGKIYPFRTYTMLSGRPYSIEFNGGVLIPFEDRYEELGCRAAEFIHKNNVSGSQRGICPGSQNGSQRKASVGSQRGFLGGSQRSLLGGSQRGILGSSQRGIHEHEFEFETGSQRGLFGGSQRGLLGGSQRSFLGGSQRGLSGGSQRGVSENRYYEGDANAWQQTEYWSYIPIEWQIINRSQRHSENKGGCAEFGYGLDLI